LKKSESMLLPAFDVAIWVKNNISESDKQRQAQGGGLKIAGADGKREEEGISVLMSVDKDEATRRRERDAEAEAKRQQNIMPAWHLKSTISGELTALGVAATTPHTNGATSNAAILSSLGSSKQSSNADILSGLGKVRPPPKVVKEEVTVVPEKKPVVTQDAAFFEQYYASLEAANQARSTTQTPMMDTLGSDFEEEDRKPILTYLDSPNPSGKRSRSREDDGERTSKAMRSTAGTPTFSRATSGFASAVDTPSPLPDVGIFRSDGEGDIEVMEAVDGLSAEDPVVFVGGFQMPFSQVTQEIADERMTPEEYTAWYELCLAQS